MTIIWTIPTLDRRSSDGFVTTAHWRATAQDGADAVDIYGTCSWEAGEPIFPYETLTEEQVLGWCWNSGVNKEATEAALTAQLDAKKNPPIQNGIPWNPLEA